MRRVFVFFRSSLYFLPPSPTPLLYFSSSSSFAFSPYSLYSSLPIPPFPHPHLFPFSSFIFYASVLLLAPLSSSLPFLFFTQCVFYHPSATPFSFSFPIIFSLSLPNLHRLYFFLLWFFIHFSFVSTCSSSPLLAPPPPPPSVLFLSKFILPPLPSHLPLVIFYLFLLFFIRHSCSSSPLLVPPPT